MAWPDNATDLLEDRYLQKTADGETTEDLDDMLERVAGTVAQTKQQREEFLKMLKNADFLPNSPTLMNAGTDMQQLSACFVLPVEDDLGEIYQTIKEAALIWKSGGGTGFSFSRLRPRGAFVNSTQGRSKGPLSFIEVFNASAGTVEQGGKRPGANMALLRVDHPDIEEFIYAKTEEGKFSNFNFSVGITDEFLRHLHNDAQEFPLRDPRHQEAVDTVNPAKIWDALAQAAWTNGEPGIVFLDRINAQSGLWPLGRIRAINPCGEQPLLPYESCNLGSINLANHLTEGGLDKAKLSRTTKSAVRFLDNVIDVNEYPLKAVAEQTRATRKIGLGVMGWAEALAALGVPYDSRQARNMAQQTMRFINGTAHRCSADLANERGPFPAWTADLEGRKRRNATLTTIAPTGSISQLAGTSFGIEPFYSLSYKHNDADMKFDFDPDDVKTATELDPEAHVKMQAAFQGHTDNAVSKTVNIPPKATLEDVKEIFRTAYRQGCKGITVYRDGSRDEQVLNATCPECGAELVPSEGCYVCPECDYAPCSI